MLSQLLSRFFRRPEPKRSAASRELSLDAANGLMQRGDRHAAISEFRKYLETDPFNVEALNSLGACLADTGNTAEASATFELAYSLDDNFIPAVINHAKLLVDRRRSCDALPFLQEVKLGNPRFSHSDVVYAALCLNLGHAKKARHFQLRGWLGNFDDLRVANCYLFTTAYEEVDEAELAAEHRFWAETLLSPEMQVEGALLPVRKPSSKIRIGYWSPDFRNHSVRYFFRPLLEGHDLTNFEVFLYHDFPKKDRQTELMEAACDHFHDVYELSDGDLYKLVRSHQLDIFVELAGHTSHNRANSLVHRFATLQITALGYPPTTGLGSIDAKVLDRYVVTADSSRYYAEYPLELPSSFWCFDPMEDAPINPDPPAVRNGYVTFGCVGNIAKISDEILGCWKLVLEQVPKSRLLVRSISFEDPAAIEAMKGRLAAIHLDLDKIDLRPPEGGAAFFESYNQIDIVFDTFPFNGGTTSCFATYMGVPIVSLSGESLVSRMGLSILTNLGEADLAVQSYSAYVTRAVALGKDMDFLRRFRREARGRFQASSLGNGKLFAANFESACTSLLLKKQEGLLQYEPQIDLLPAREIIRRAYVVLRSGQTASAQRIVNHCLLHYPDCGNAHLLQTQLWGPERPLEEAIQYLEARIHGFSPDEQTASLIHLTRLYLLLAQTEPAARAIERLSATKLPDTFDRMQVQLYRACMLPTSPIPQPTSTRTNLRAHVIIPCESDERFLAVRTQIISTCRCPSGWVLTFGQCSETRRIAAYVAELSRDDVDILVIAQKNLEIHNSQFFEEIAAALEGCDLLGMAGATRWQRMDWRSEEFGVKSAGFLVPSTESQGSVEVQWLGTAPGVVGHGMAVLDGSLLALNPKRLRHIDFDPELLRAELLLEEDWAHAAYRGGLRLAVHRNLGVLLNQQIELDSSNRTSARYRCAEKLQINVFAVEKDDFMLLSAPVADAATAVQVCRTFVELST